MEEERIRFGKWEKVRIVLGTLKGNEYLVEGYWDELTGKSWLETDFRPAIMNYAFRTSTEKHLKEYEYSEEVLYGKIGIYGHLVHVSEIERL